MNIYTLAKIHMTKHASSEDSTSKMRERAIAKTREAVNNIKKLKMKQRVTENVYNQARIGIARQRAKGLAALNRGDNATVKKQWEGTQRNMQILNKAEHLNGQYGLERYLNKTKAKRYANIAKNLQKRSIVKRIGTALIERV